MGSHESAFGKEDLGVKESGLENGTSLSTIFLVRILCQLRPTRKVCDTSHFHNYSNTAIPIVTYLSFFWRKRFLLQRGKFRIRWGFVGRFLDGRLDNFRSRFPRSYQLWFSSSLIEKTEDTKLENSAT